MKEETKNRLLGLGLTDEQVGKLAAEGATEDGDIALLSSEQIKTISGCGAITAEKIVAAFRPATTATVSAAAPDAEIPEGAKPSPAQVNGFAAQLGIDPGTLMMFMMSAGTANAGMGALDISSMIPIKSVVDGYNPKIRNMFLVVMGQIESRMGVPIVVINEDGSVNRELTTEYIEGLEEGRDEAENNIYFDGSGKAHEVIAVGVDAQSIYDADPLVPTKALQKSGMGTGRVMWNGVGIETRQTAYYAVLTGEIDPTDEDHLTWVRDHIKPEARRLVFQGRAPKAIARFNEAQRTGSLPTLRVMLSRAPRRKETGPRRRFGAPRDLAGIGGVRRGERPGGGDEEL